MTKEPWTIEGELCKLAEAEYLNEALARLGLIASPLASFDLETIHPWSRSGGETYSFIFTVSNPGGEKTVCRLKACTAFPGARDIENTLAVWLHRRNLLADEGISSPRLFGSGGGVLLEEEIPLDIPTAMQMGSPERVLSGLVDIAAALVRLKFAPVSAFADIRSRGQDAVFIDFGADLGEPGVGSGLSGPIFDQLLEQLTRWKVELASPEQEQLREAFEMRIASKLQ